MARYSAGGWRLVMAGVTNQGTRPKNDDELLINERLGLAVVCDGVGSVASGRLGARLAALLTELFVEAGLEMGVENPLRRAVTLASLALKGAREDVRVIRWGTSAEAGTVPVEGFALGAGAKTTLVALLAQPDGLEIVWAGDSPCFRVTASGLQRLTRDDAEGGGQLTQWISHLRRDFSNHLVIRDVRPGDLFLLCSDGLVKSGGLALAHDRLAGLAEAGAPPDHDSWRRELEEILHGVVTESVERARGQGVDNTTAVVVGIAEAPELKAAVREETICVRRPDEPTRDWPPREREEGPGPAPPPPPVPAEPRILSEQREPRRTWRAAALVAAAAALVAAGAWLIAGWLGARENPYVEAVKSAVSGGGPDRFQRCAAVAGSVVDNPDSAPEARTAADLCAALFAPYVFDQDALGGGGGLAPLRRYLLTRLASRGEFVTTLRALVGEGDRGGGGAGSPGSGGFSLEELSRLAREAAGKRASDGAGDWLGSLLVEARWDAEKWLGDRGKPERRAQGFLALIGERCWNPRAERAFEGLRAIVVGRRHDLAAMGEELREIRCPEPAVPPASAAAPAAAPGPPATPERAATPEPAVTPTPAAKPTPPRRSRERQDERRRSASRRPAGTAGVGAMPGPQAVTQVSLVKTPPAVAASPKPTRTPPAEPGRAPAASAKGTPASTTAGNQDRQEKLDRLLAEYLGLVCEDGDEAQREVLRERIEELLGNPNNGGLARWMRRRVVRRNLDGTLGLAEERWIRSFRCPGSRPGGGSR